MKGILIGVLANLITYIVIYLLVTLYHVVAGQHISIGMPDLAASGTWSWIIAGAIGGSVAGVIVFGPWGGCLIFTVIGILLALVASVVLHAFGVVDGLSFWGSFIVATVVAIVSVEVCGRILRRRASSLGFGTKAVTDDESHRDSGKGTENGRGEHVR